MHAKVVHGLKNNANRHFTGEDGITVKHFEVHIKVNVSGKVNIPLIYKAR
jgi:hypothetical protein